MHFETLEKWKHSHSFGQERKRPGENRTIIVIIITATMMVVEITTGLLFGSMALLADGLHMGSHAAALTITAFAYVYARKHAHDEQFSFGTGKVNALGGFAGAILLAVFALIMAWESIHRLFFPVEIIFNQAILVAVIGLVVNGASVFILDHSDHDHHHHHHHGDQADHHHDDAHHHGHHDHNLRAAYFHVLADALTSVLAIVALLAAKYFGWIWMDPIVGIVGAILISKWSIGLIKTSGSILLDKQGPESVLKEVRRCIEEVDDNRVADLHLWSIGPNIFAAEISVVTHTPKEPDFYKQLIPKNLKVVHCAVEIHQCVHECACG